MSASVKATVLGLDALARGPQRHLEPAVSEVARIEHPCELCGMREQEQELQAGRRVFNVCWQCAQGDE